MGVALSELENPALEMVEYGRCSPPQDHPRQPLNLRSHPVSSRLSSIFWVYLALGTICVTRAHTGNRYGFRCEQIKPPRGRTPPWLGAYVSLSTGHKPPFLLAGCRLLMFGTSLVRSSVFFFFFFSPRWRKQLLSPCSQGP